MQVLNKIGKWTVTIILLAIITQGCDEKCSDLSAADDTFTYTFEEYQDALVADDWGGGWGSDGSVALYFELGDILGNDNLDGRSYDEVAITIASQPAHGAAVYSAQKFIYMPGDDFSGEDSFTYRICAGGQCSEATVTITVSDFQAGGTFKAADDTFIYTFEEYEEELNSSGAWARALFLPVSESLGNDELDGHTMDELTISIASQPAHGAVAMSNFTDDQSLAFEYVPGDDFSGEDSFTYKICHDGRCSEATVKILVTDFEW